MNDTPQSDDAAEDSDHTSERPESIRLDQFLKFAGLVETGGQAKLLIQDGEVQVNGEVERRRRRQLVDGDEVTFDGESYVIEFGED